MPVVLVYRRLKHLIGDILLETYGANMCAYINREKNMHYVDHVMLILYLFVFTLTSYAYVFAHARTKARLYTRAYGVHCFIYVFYIKHLIEEYL